MAKVTTGHMSVSLDWIEARAREGVRLFSRGDEDLSVDEVLELVAEHRAMGHTVYPACHHTDAEGRCLGHVEEETS